MVFQEITVVSIAIFGNVGSGMQPPSTNATMTALHLQTTVAVR